MLLEKIKAQMFQAMKSGDTVAKEILKVAVGEITTDQARPGRTGSDEETLALLKKLVKANEETLASTTDAEQRSTLLREVAVLMTFLPRALGVEEILQALEPVSEALRAAGSAGQATGIAVKHLKAAGLEVGGKDVAAAVERLRGG